MGKKSAFCECVESRQAMGIRKSDHCQQTKTAHELLTCRHATGDCGQDDGRERGDLHDCCDDIINQYYLNGSKSGEGKFFSKSGKLTKEVSYHNGTMNALKEY